VSELGKMLIVFGVIMAVVGLIGSGIRSPLVALVTRDDAFQTVSRLLAKANEYPFFCYRWERKCSIFCSNSKSPYWHK
jgi:hypothetical protein